MLQSVITCIINQLLKFEKLLPHSIPYIWAMSTATILTIANLFVKKLSKEGFTTSEILFFRSLQLVVYSYMLMKLRNMEFVYKNTTINRLLIARGLAGTLGVGMVYYGIGLMPFSDATVICQITPVITGVLATLILGEKYELSQFVAAIVCLLGIIFVAQPPAIFGTNETQNATDSANKVLGTVVLLISTVMFSLVEILIKKVGGKANTGITSMVFGIVSCMIASTASLSQGFIQFKLHHLVWLFCVGFLSFIGQFFRQRAFELGNAGRVSNMGYFGIVVGYLLDIFVMGNTINLLSLFGGCCILSCMFIYLYAINRKEKQAQKAKILSFETKA